jgi:anti-sigma B factor antagonist
VGGEIDINTAPLMKQHLDEAIDKGPAHVIVDFSGVRYVDSTGLGALVGCRRRLQAAGGQMSLICNNQHVLKLFEITGLSQLFDMYESEAALRAKTPLNSKTTRS